jgi:hypothetical protein
MSCFLKRCQITFLHFLQTGRGEATSHVLEFVFGSWREELQSLLPLLLIVWLSGCSNFAACLLNNRIKGYQYPSCRWLGEGRRSVKKHGSQCRLLNKRVCSSKSASRLDLSKLGNSAAPGVAGQSRMQSYHWKVLLHLTTHRCDTWFFARSGHGFPQRNQVSHQGQQHFSRRPRTHVGPRPALAQRNAPHSLEVIGVNARRKWKWRYRRLPSPMSGKDRTAACRSVPSCAAFTTLTMHNSRGKGCPWEKTDHVHQCLYWRSGSPGTPRPPLERLVHGGAILATAPETREAAGQQAGPRAVTDPPRPGALPSGGPGLPESSLSPVRHHDAPSSIRRAESRGRDNDGLCKAAQLQEGQTRETEGAGRTPCQSSPFAPPRPPHSPCCPATESRPPEPGANEDARPGSRFPIPGRVPPAAPAHRLRGSRRGPTGPP